VIGIPTLTFDPEGIHRAVLNICTNAVDACDGNADAKVIVATEHDVAAGKVRVTVEDNGSGIEPEDLDKIFTIFVSRKGGRGTGLGLPVSQKILREHGGDIHVESELGKGSRFTLTLPLASASVPAPAPGPVRPQKVDSAGGVLFEEGEISRLRSRWADIQSGFVDEPRRSVQEADSLVTATMKRLAEQFAAERSNLEGQWDRGSDISTEDLRIALRRYRAFFGRLLSI